MIKLNISADLKKILEPIKSMSQVASLLYNEYIEDEFLVEKYVDYITVSENDPSKISYISQSKLKNLDVDTAWEASSGNRVQNRPGSFISKIFKGISSKEVENFSNLFISQSCKKPVVFKVLYGNDIPNFYHYKSYKRMDGSLGASCMKHDHCQRYFELYKENSANISMLVMFDDNDQDKCVGRALLWNVEKDGEKIKIMDRIYTINDEQYSFYFKQWASSNNYFFKSEQNWFNTIFFEKIGSERVEIKLEIKLKNALLNKYPYMDTFKFMDMNTGVLTNYLPDNIRDVRVLCGSEGNTQSNDYLVFDKISKVLRYRNDAAYINYGENNFYTGRDNAQYSNYNDRWMLREDCVYNEIIGDYIFIEELRSLNNPDIYASIKEREENDKKRAEKRGKVRASGSYGLDSSGSTAATDFTSFLSRTIPTSRVVESNDESNENRLRESNEIRQSYINRYERFLDSLESSTSNIEQNTEPFLDGSPEPQSSASRIFMQEHRSSLDRMRLINERRFERSSEVGIREEDIDELPF